MPHRRQWDASFARLELECSLKEREWIVGFATQRVSLDRDNQSRIQPAFANLTDHKLDVGLLVLASGSQPIDQLFFEGRKLIDIRGQNPGWSDLGMQRAGTKECQA